MNHYQAQCIVNEHYKFPGTNAVETRELREARQTLRRKQTPKICSNRPKFNYPKDAEITPYSDQRIKQMAQIIADQFSITPEDIKKRDRAPIYKVPRQILQYLCTQFLPQVPMRIIATESGVTHYSTVIHARDTINDRIDTESSFKALMDKLVEKINNLNF